MRLAVSGAGGGVEPGRACVFAFMTIEHLLLRKAESMFIYLCAQEETCLMAQHVEQRFDLRNVAALFRSHQDTDDSHDFKAEITGGRTPSLFIKKHQRCARL